MIRPSLSISAAHHGTHERCVRVKIRTPEGSVEVVVSPDCFGRAVTGESEVDVLDYTWRRLVRTDP